MESAEGNILYERITEDIYRIPVPLPNNPLRATNAYLIRGTESNLLIDSGFRRDECRIQLNESLKALNVDKKTLDVAVTHVHSDHLGLVSEMAGADRDIYISKIDSQYLNKILTGRHSRQLHKMILKSGYPEDILSEVEKRLPSKIYSVNERDIRIQPVEDGQVVSVGQYQLQFIFVPGHSLGNAMLWDKKHGIMFTGDHILFDITPNITVFADMQDSLGAYLDSLERSKKYPVTMALPGHRMSGDYYKRIGELIQHHKNRLEEMLTVLEQHPNSNAYEIASNMSWHIHGNGWEDFPDRQKWYAVGETLAHLEYLVKRNMAFRYGKSGVYYYQAEPVARRVLAEIFLKKNK